MVRHFIAIAFHRKGEILGRVTSRVIEPIVTPQIIAGLEAATITVSASAQARYASAYDPKHPEFDYSSWIDRFRDWSNSDSHATLIVPGVKSALPMIRRDSFITGCERFCPTVPYRVSL